MAYKALKSIFHEADATTHEAEYLHRVDSESALQWNFLVGEWPLFCLVTPEMAKLLVEVQARESEMARLAGSLPLQAITQYFQELVTDEVLSTNEMEGVRSTRAEVQGTLFQILDQPARDRTRSRARFAEFVGLYLDLFSRDGERKRRRPQDLNGIRAVYDAVTPGEVSAEDAPDGKRFRADGVQVFDGSNRIRHSGVVPESSIESRLQSMLVALADEAVPPVLRAVIGHFMFEYVHPFYNGNGRTGRYLLSQDLAHALGPLTALRLSRKVSELKKIYYHATYYQWGYYSTQASCNHYSNFYATFLMGQNQSGPATQKFDTQQPTM